jgi:antirestriction protein ArdC
MTAAFLCASLGIVPTVRHADYIGSWLEVLRDDDRAIVRAASAASKAADYLLAFQADEDGPESPPGPTIAASAPESEREAGVPVE